MQFFSIILRLVWAYKVALLYFLGLLLYLGLKLDMPVGAHFDVAKFIEDVATPFAVFATVLVFGTPIIKTRETIWRTFRGVWIKSRQFLKILNLRI